MAVIKRLVRIELWQTKIWNFQDFPALTDHFQARPKDYGYEFIEEKTVHQQKNVPKIWIGVVIEHSLKHLPINCDILVHLLNMKFATIGPT